MSKQATVSIIVSSYNYGQFLSSAIDSALAQTHAAVEVIVVDDGSTDHSPDIIRSYRNRIIAVFQRNGGQASAMNSGFERSHGQIVIFLDADDMLAPETASHVAEAFAKNPLACKVQYRLETVTAEGARTGIIRPPRSTPLPAGDLRRCVLAFPFDMTWMATSGNAFSRQLLDAILPIPEADFRILADFYLAHLSALHGPVVSLEEIGGYYRIHGSNAFASHIDRIDLARIRSATEHMRSTNVYLIEAAKALGLRASAGGPETSILSVSYIANRAIWRKLDRRGSHDGFLRLSWLGIRASLGRFDVPVTKRLLFLVWFLALLASPTRLARWLAERFLFPSRRRILWERMTVQPRIR